MRHSLSRYLMSIILLLSMVLPAQAQDAGRKKALPKGIKTAPQFPGGDVALYQFINNHMRYPDQARENEIQGKIVVSFLVLKDGSVSMPTIVQGKALGNGIPNEVLRVIKSLPKFSPAKDTKGRPVDFLYTTNLNFKID